MLERWANNLERWGKRIENWRPVEDAIEARLGQKVNWKKFYLVMIPGLLILLYGLLWALIGLSLWEG